VAAGALHTPAVLLRSGVRGRGHTGRHLRLHPATVAIGFFEGPSEGVLRCCTFRESTPTVTGLSCLPCCCLLVAACLLGMRTNKYWDLELTALAARFLLHATRLRLHVSSLDKKIGDVPDGLHRYGQRLYMSASHIVVATIPLPA
jgi:hypothetical protein